MFAALADLAPVARQRLTSKPNSPVWEAVREAERITAGKSFEFNGGTCHSAEWQMGRLRGVVRVLSRYA